MRRLIGPAISAAVMFAVLVGLGVWQVERLAWKEGLLAQIAAAEAAPAIPLTDNPPPFAKVRVSGFFRPQQALYGADVRDTPAGTVMGAQVIAALSRAGAPPVLVDRGWVPDRPGGPPPPPAGEVTVEGYVRAGERAGMFSAPDDLPGRRFYTLSPVTIGPAVGAPEAEPFTLVAVGKDVPGSYPAPAETLPRPPNDHLSYAMTWFGLAATLAVIFVLYVRKALRA